MNSNHLTTEQAASQLSIKAQTIRKRYCQTGSYFGVIPCKLANGRLLWPANVVERLAIGGAR